MRRFFGKRAGLWMCILALVCLAGCGKADETGGGIERGSEKGERTEYDLGTGSWKEFQEIKELEEGWVPTDYWEESGLDISDPDMRKWSRRYVSEGMDFYIIQEYGKQASEEVWSVKYYLKHIDLAARREEMYELDFSGSDAASKEVKEAMDAGRMMLQGADVLDGKICLFLSEFDSVSNTIPHAYVVWLDSERKLDKIVELEPELKRAGMIANNMLPQNFLCDRDGRLYLYNSSEIAVIDGQGKLIKKLDDPGDESMIMHTSRLTDGRPVFERLNYASDKTVIFCFEGEEEKILYQGKYSYVKCRSLNEYGEILYLDQKSLFRWDAEAGTCDQIYKDASLKIEYCEAIIEDSSDGSIVLIFYENERLYLLKLRQEPDREETNITVYLFYNDGDIEKYADQYTQTHPGTKVNVVTRNQEDPVDMALNKLMVQIQEGKGPDLIVPFGLEDLQRKNMLMDLSELLPESLLENIFGGVLQENTIDGRLYGISFTAYASTIAVSRDVWQGEKWTSEDVMNLMESGGKDGKGFEGFLGNDSPGNLLFYLVSKDIMAGKSSLVDQENKQCYFDTDYFVRVLEFCKKHGAESDSYLSGEERIQRVHSGRILACTVGNAGNLRSFTMDLEDLGEDFHCVGYPTEGEYGGYVSAGSCIAVNAATDNQETALDFIQYLLSEKVQREVGINTVRRDVLVDNVRDAIGEDDRPVFKVGDKTVVELGKRSDGSSFLPEYLEVMERGEPDPQSYDEIAAIIREEADSFFQGEKTAQDVAKIIQRRISLYLNER